jgi:hypothetical protein
LGQRREEVDSILSKFVAIILEKHLHIVSLDVPYPPDYGGIISIFVLVKKLHELGIHIHLHCFEYGRGQQKELEKYCDEVFYYERRNGMKGFSLRLPYIVSSRKSKELKRNLLKDSHPILMEGVHCSYLAFDPALKNRKLLVRLHNAEFVYYRHLFRNTNDLFKKAYYFFESKLLERYERKLASFAKIVAVSAEDALLYKRKFHAKDINYLPLVIRHDVVHSKPGRGKFCLYHGHLSVPENEKAAIWLVKKVFDKVDVPLVIAGKDPTHDLKKIITSRNNISLVENPSDSEMQELIETAQINILLSFNSTGIKLKLLNSLFNGRHCIVNAAMACGTQLISLCHVADDDAEFKSLVKKLYDETFTDAEIQNRKKILSRVYDNVTNTQSLVQLIY